MERRIIDQLIIVGHAIDTNIQVGVDEWQDPTYYAYIVSGDRLFRLVTSIEAFRAETEMPAVEMFAGYVWEDIGAWCAPETEPRMSPWERAGVTWSDFI